MADDRPTGFFARLERLLKPFYGGAQVGSLDAPLPPAAPEWTCDTCGRPAHEHRFESAGHGRMYCPEPAEA